MAELERGELEAGGGGGGGSYAGGGGGGTVAVGGAKGRIPGVGSYLSNLSPESPSYAGGGGIAVGGVGGGEPARGRRRRMRRTSAHHEAALVAASKLGMWEEALRIYREVEGWSPSPPPSGGGGEGGVSVTDNMILSVIGACVRGSKVKYAAACEPPPSPAVGDSPALVGGTDVADPTDGGDREGDATAHYATRTTPLPSTRPTRMRALTVDERRRPLDEARGIILSMESRHDIPLVSRHVNPLASAYNRLGLRAEASALINGHLKDRAPPPPPTPPARHPPKKSGRWRERRESAISETNPGFEAVQLAEWSDDDLDGDDGDDGGGMNANPDVGYDDVYEEAQLNVYELKAKDRASYSLLVQGAAMEGDWIGAVEELRRMTDAGLHPNSRNLNSWNEVMERGCRPLGNRD
jgi:hypothetical protein